MKQQEFAHTADDVNKTMDDFHNYGGKNVPLWLRGDFSIHYAGISGDEHVNIVPQAGLNDDETRVTIILPGGSEEKVDNTLDRKDTDELRGKIYGLKGKIGDRVHTTAKVLKDSYRNNRGYAAFQGFMINLKK
jgi:hypothetical protein